MTDDPDALMALILNDPDATPEDVKGAADSGVVTQAHARAWLVGYLAGLRATPPPPAGVRGGLGHASGPKPSRPPNPPVGPNAPPVPPPTPATGRMPAPTLDSEGRHWRWQDL